MAQFLDTARGAIKSGLSALAQPEGLATGALGGFLFGGPVGLALGLGQGILAKRLRQSELDAAAADQATVEAFDQQHEAAIAAAQGNAATDLDRQQLNSRERNYQMLRQLSQHPDADVRTKAIEKMSTVMSDIDAWLEDVEGRKETMMDRDIGVLDEQATTARNEYMKGLETAQGTQKLGEEMHRLLSDPEFDVNSGPGRARLANLLGTTPRELLADPTEMVDAWAALGSAAGPVGAAIGEFFKGRADAKDFTFTREQWRQVAHAMTLTSQNLLKRRLADAAQRGQLLDQSAGKIGHRPALSYIDRILTGKVQDTATVSGEPGAYGMEGSPGEPGANIPPPPGRGESLFPATVRGQAQRAGAKASETFDDLWRWPLRQFGITFGEEALGKDRNVFDIGTFRDLRRPTNE